MADADVREAAALDIDWMSFEVAPSQPIGKGSVRLPVVASIGTTEWVRFHIDLADADLRMTDQPDDVPPLARGVMPDVEQRGYRAYPIVDHVADKAAATYKRHGTTGEASTRYRDLVDLVAIVTGVSIDAAKQWTALRSEFDRRELELPSSFDVPDHEAWERGYEREVRNSLLPIAPTLDGALEIVRPFFDPLLTGKAAGTWSHIRLEWTCSDP